MTTDLSENGGMVTTRTTEETIITLNPARTYELYHVGIDSGGTDRATAKLLYTTNGSTVTANFAEAVGKFYLFQSSSTYSVIHSISGVGLLRVIGVTAEGTLQIRLAG